MQSKLFVCTHSASLFALAPSLAAVEQAPAAAAASAANPLLADWTSPHGRTLYVNAYSPGQTLAITGPW